MRVFRLLLFCWSLRAVFASGVTAQDSDVPIRISKETTYITSPLRDDGTVDYVEALSQRQREGVTAENNSVVMFRRALCHEDLSAETSDEYFRQLGIEALPKDGPYLISLDGFLDALNPAELPDLYTETGELVTELFRRKKPIEKQYYEAISRPWTRGEFPILSRWVDTNETPLELVLEGSKRPKFFYPLLSADRLLARALLTGYQGYRGCVDVLKARAMLQLGEENFDAAWHDVMACHRIARLIAQGPTGVDVLIGVAIESAACRCDDAIALHGNLSADQLRCDCTELQNLGVITGMADRLGTGDRYSYLEGVIQTAERNAGNLNGFMFRKPLKDIENIDDINEGVSTVVDSLRRSFTQGLVDVNIVLKIGNYWHDRLVVAAHLPTRMARQSEFDKIDAELQPAMDEARTAFVAPMPVEMRDLSEKVGVLLLLNDAFLFRRKIVDVEDSCAMRTQLSHFAFALAAWKADHGNYPDQLNQLTPDYLKIIPIDNHTGQSLIYRRSDTGYLLYSLGVNLKDDDGLTKLDTYKTDDIAIRTPDEDRRIEEVVKNRRSGN